jgi:hypothetical protein
MWVREALEYCKQSLMSNSDGRSEDQNAHRYVDRKYGAHEFSDWNKDSIKN